MKQIELIEKRKPREKHFLQEDGTIKAILYDDDIHYLKNGRYEEIDNELIKENDYYVNKNNSYKVKFKENSKDELMKIEAGEHYLNIKIKENKDTILPKILKQSKIINDIKYKEILENIDLEYKVLPNMVKESIIIKEKSKVPEKLTFDVSTDLKLIINHDRSISAVKDNHIIFKIDAPYMIDGKNRINNNINYLLTEMAGIYELTLELDKDWLNSPDTVYPVIIDPTISNSENSTTVYDTYIYPGDTGIDKNSQSFIKAGVERVNEVNVVNRSLIRFNLPSLNTGDEVLHAELNLTGYQLDGYEVFSPQLVNVHQVTSEWNETGATWDTMHDKFDNKAETCFYAQRSPLYIDELHPVTNFANITNLVKKWYTDVPNYGLLLKVNDETYKSDMSLPAFYSRNNSISNYDPKPLLTVTYRNQNGYEKYMNSKQQIFQNGSVFSNTYNGNVTAIFDLAQIPNSKMNTNLKLVYNTNDVVDNYDCGYGKGLRLNVIQTLENYSTGANSYLIYTDSDGTKHYFRYENGSYIDEDALGIEITMESNKYLLTDTNGLVMKFIPTNNMYYLTEIVDSEGNYLTITYNSEKKVTKIVDSHEKSIDIAYSNNSILIQCENGNVTINYSNNRVSSITDSRGTTTFSYNSNSLITRITDDLNDIAYEYYENKPYKIKKIIEYSNVGTEGNHLVFEYGFNSTTITDRTKVKTYIFDSLGNISSISNLKNAGSLKEAYSIRQVSGDSGKRIHKITSTGIPIKYVKNYLNNISFEQSKLDFMTSAGTSMEITSETANYGNNSLKVIGNKENSYIFKEIEVARDNKYTFSGYIKNSSSVQIEMYYTDAGNNVVKSVSEIIEASDTFERCDVSIEYSNTAKTKLGIKICMLELGTMYLDDIQLEDGEVMNNYNLLENSDFSNGLTDWQTDVTDFESGTSDGLNINDYFSVVDMDSNEKALKITMNPSLSTNLTKTIKLSGKAGDIYNISFWYKNEGTTPSTDFSMNCVIINFINTENTEYGHCVLPSTPLNINRDNWQYFSYNFKAEYDYTGVVVSFLQSENSNNLYLTDMSLFKNIRESSYDYDDEGRVISVKTLNNLSEGIEYNKNSQITKLIDRKNHEYQIEYDNEIKTRPLNSLSPTGIVEENKYNSEGNVTTTRTKYINNKIENLRVYAIRAKGTSKYIRTINNIITLDEYALDGWKLKEESSGLYSMSHPIVNDLYISALSDAVYADTYSNYSSQFHLIETGKGTYYIKLVSYNKYIKNDCGYLTVADKVDNDESFEFCFERIENNEFIESNLAFDSTGRFKTKITDSYLREKKYEVNSKNGLTTKSINSKGQEIKYNYNAKNQLSSIEFENKRTDFIYNDNGIIKQIKSGSKEYNIEYDEFNNLKKISLGNGYTFVTNTYQNNNGNLASSVYGNGNINTYNYDEYNRIKKVNKQNETYEFLYNNNGDLTKVNSSEEKIKYVYDDAKRLNKYIYNDLKIKYLYDSTDSIDKKYISIKDKKYSIQCEYDEDDIIKTVVYDNDVVKYNYDNLGRLVSKCLNDVFKVSCKYITNGHRTTDIVKKIVNGTDKIQYKYDKFGNISHIYKNNVLANRYFYNSYDEIIREDDYEQNHTIRYKYDLDGNIISNKKYKLNTFEYICGKKYEYSDALWSDKLTKFDDKTISYDNMGNPLTIGNNIRLTWKNGKDLESYIDETNEVYYKYRVDGLRRCKIVNGLKTDYYYENETLILEKTGNNVIYYIRNNLDGLIGFKYNDVVYYYLKNLHNDIIGILDSSFNLLCSYHYDAWGNCISIKDSNGNDIKNNSNHIANINPYRYRSYYFDKETKLYYLRQRYYNAEWCRFINSDLIVTISADCSNTYNMFAYANNNPVSYDDYNGTLFKSITEFFNKVKEVGKKIIDYCKEKGKKAGSSVNKSVSSPSKANVNTIERIGSSVINSTDIVITGSKNISEPIIYSSFAMKVTYSKTSVVTIGDTGKPIAIEHSFDNDGRKIGVVFGGTVAIRKSIGLADKSMELGIGKGYVTLGTTAIPSSSLFVEIGVPVGSEDGVASTVHSLKFETNPIVAVAVVAVYATGGLISSGVKAIGSFFKSAVSFIH